MTETAMCYEEKCCKEKTEELSIVVQKALIDPSSIKEIADRQKTRFFAKLGLFKPKRKETDCESVSLYYEPFHLIKAKYRIDYYKRNTYTIEIKEKVSEIIIFDHTLIPDNPKTMKKLLKKPHKEINLDAQDRVIHEVIANVAQDRTGREINPNKLPSAPSLKKPEKALAEFGEKVRKPTFSPEKLINNIRERIAKKPSDTERIVEELFEVSENTVIYTPVYEARCRNLKTGEIKIIPISGVTGKPFYP